MEQGELDALHGRIIIACLFSRTSGVALMMVVQLLLSKGAKELLLALAIARGKALLSVSLAIVSGLWLLSWLMGRVGRVRSRELFLLTVLVLCLGAALSTYVFGLSVVFGAFVIGFILRRLGFVHQALAKITPLWDIFATLFFVSLGMLLSPRFVLEHWSSVVTVVRVIIL